jgi:hypothetical protein
MDGFCKKMELMMFKKHFLGLILGLFTVSNVLNCADRYDLASLKEAMYQSQQAPAEKDAAAAQGAGAVGLMDSGAAASAESSVEDDSIFAKIALLSGCLVHFPGHYQYSTLLNGADLYENNVISGLYTLLVASSKKMLDEHEVTVPDLAKITDPLGKWLYQFFYRNGATLSPTKSKASIAYYLTPAQIGQLYMISFDVAGNEALIKTLKPKTMSWPQFNSFVDVYRAVFAKSTPALAIQDDVMQNLARAVLLSFFWAKFISDSAISVTMARSNIDKLYSVISKNPSVAATVDLEGRSLVWIEAEIIKRIIQNYTSNLPKPPIQGTVMLPSGKDFPDCGESCIRGLFLAAFYVPKAKKLVVPDHSENPSFYKPEIRVFFDEFPDLVAQSSNVARNKWGIMLSGLPGIEYNESLYDLKTSLINTALLLAQLVPGSYQNFLVATGQEVDLDPKAIHGCLSSSRKNVEKFLEQFAQDHKLKIFDFEDVGDDTTFKVHSTSAKKKDSPVIAYTLEPKHMDCLLRLSNNRHENLISKNPLIAYDILRYTIPLIFAAYDLASNGLFKDGYLALLPVTPKANLDYIITNIKDWGNLRPEDQELLDNHDKALYKALKARLDQSAKYLIDNYIDKDTSNIISVVVEKPRLIEQLAAQGFNVNIREKVPFCEGCSLNTPLEIAVMLGNYRSAKVLLKYGADFTIPYVYGSDGKSILNYVIETEDANSPLKKVFEEYALIGA